jgi:hypothetical protein
MQNRLRARSYSCQDVSKVRKWRRQEALRNESRMPVGEWENGETGVVHGLDLWARGRSTGKQSKVKGWRLCNRTLSLTSGELNVALPSTSSPQSSLQLSSASPSLVLDPRSPCVSLPALLGFLPFSTHPDCGPHIIHLRAKRAESTLKWITLARLRGSQKRQRSAKRGFQWSSGVGSSCACLLLARCLHV